ncbi:MAG: GNAT family N-acetyltransferase [Fuerstiella sp.]
MIDYEDKVQVSAIERGALKTETNWDRYVETGGQLEFIHDGNVVGEPVVGFVAFRVFPEFVRVDRIAVAPKCQRSGLGGYLLQMVQHRFRQHLIFVDVASSNPGLIRFFGRSDFRSLANLSAMKQGRNIARLCWVPVPTEPTFEVA